MGRSRAGVVKLVTKYTFVLVAALGIAIAGLDYLHAARDQRHFDDDMRVDHRVVGRVLQTLVAQIWQDARGQDSAVEQARHLIELANSGGGTTRFVWDATAQPAGEVQRVVGDQFVSQFPVRSGGLVVGAVVVRESLEERDRMMHADLAYTGEGFAVIVAICLIASLAFGGWLVGKPIRQLVGKARRVADRDFAGAVLIGRRDELGELAAEMNAMSDTLAGALTQIATETEARVAAVEQLRPAERLATVGTLAAGLAHEVGTPLSIISGHAEMIARGEVTGAHVIASAAAIEREAGRMGGIVRQLLDFARRKGPAGTVCDPAEVVRRCLTFLGPVAEKSSVTCCFDASPQPVLALIDEDSLQHVITNLVVNAVQAMPGGGTLRVAVGRAPAAPRVRIEIADTGTGIAPDVLPHIFEPFFTTKQPGDGTGLGLAVAYGIVDDHHGRILVEPNDQGTTFSVLLVEAP